MKWSTREKVAAAVEMTVEKPGTENLTGLKTLNSELRTTIQLKSTNGNYRIF
jgi:hypothetical protein